MEQIHFVFKLNIGYPITNTVIPPNLGLLGAGNSLHSENSAN